MKYGALKYGALKYALGSPVRCGPRWGGRPGRGWKAIGTREERAKILPLQAPIRSFDDLGQSRGRAAQGTAEYAGAGYAREHHATANHMV